MKSKGCIIYIIGVCSYNIGTADDAGVMERPGKDLFTLRHIYGRGGKSPLW